LTWGEFLSPSRKLDRVLIQETLLKAVPTPFLWNTDLEHLTSSLTERRLRQVVDVMEQEPCSSIQDLAVKVCLSPAHLQRLFKRQTGIQLGGLLAELRLQKAAELLTVSNLSIKEIAHAVGYGHHSSFVRAFQRRFAQAPRQYRLHPSAKTVSA
jgi:AraC family transcriptional regulator